LKLMLIRSPLPVPGHHLVPQPALPQEEAARLRLGIDEGPQLLRRIRRRGGAAIIIGRRGSSSFSAPDPGGTAT
jgi:hypothetical protein